MLFSLLFFVALTQAVNFEHAGCYEIVTTDDSELAFQFARGDGSMSAALCSARCKSYGYGDVFGLSPGWNGDQCWCGAELPQKPVPSSFCTEECSNDECGGKRLQGRTRVYYYSVYAPAQPRFVEEEGCYEIVTSDDSELAFQFARSDGSMNKDLCYEKCRGYGYGHVIGLAEGWNGDQCWCGSELPQKKVNKQMCDNTCGGDNCGGVDGQTKYYTVFEALPVEYKEDGCYEIVTSDDSELAFEFAKSGDEMSPAVCGAECLERGYGLYIGLADGWNGNQCWCGEEAPQKKVNKKMCDNTCSGFNCGGSGHYTVYGGKLIKGKNGNGNRAKATAKATVVDVAPEAGGEIDSYRTNYVYEESNSMEGWAIALIVLVSIAVVLLIVLVALTALK